MYLLFLLLFASLLPPFPKILHLHLVHKDFAHSGVPDRSLTQSEEMVFLFAFMMKSILCIFLLSTLSCTNLQEPLSQYQCNSCKSISEAEKTCWHCSEKLVGNSELRQLNPAYTPNLQISQAPVTHSHSFSIF